MAQAELASGTLVICMLLKPARQIFASLAPTPRIRALAATFLAVVPPPPPPPSAPASPLQEESDANAVEPAPPAPAADAPRGRGRAAVTRERALYFATGERASAPNEEAESWPGYYATMRALRDNRPAAQDARKRRQPVEEAPKIVWTPKRVARLSVLRADNVVQRLRDLALQSLAEHVEQLPTLEYIDATARHQVARAVVKLRRLKPEVLPLFIFPGVTEIDIPDCSNIDEDTLIRALKDCAALSVLRLGLCGRCVSDSVIDELGDSLKAVEQLQVQGCYRLSDAGCEALVRRCAPSLDAFEISCNQRITKKSIDYFCELQNLHSLTLSECPQIRDACLESLKTMKNLRKLQLNQMERLTDEFIVSLAQSLPDLEEFSVARCSQLTNIAVKGILEACRGLKVLDVSDLHLITDECFEPVREHGHALCRVSMRCCLGLTDVAVQHIAFGAKSFLETLQMSSVSPTARKISVLWFFGAVLRAMMELRYSPDQRKKSARKAKATAINRSEGLKWTSEEDSLLRDGVCKFGGKKWKVIAERIECRSPEECNKRWNKLQSLDTVVKRPWSQEEDAQMFQLVKKYGASKWAVIASYLKGRNGKQCRERWHNQLNPSIKKTPWTEEENTLILAMQAQFGNCWAKITSQLPGRTDNAVKNHWYSSLKALASRALGTVETRQQSVTSRRRRHGRRSLLALRRSSPKASSHQLLLIFLLVLTKNVACSDCLDALVVPDVDRGSLSPDAVSSVDTLDVPAYTPSYQDDVLRAQAVIDNILDPMGLGSWSNNSFNPPWLPAAGATLTTYNQSIQHTTEAWLSSDDSPTSNNLVSADPTSPAQPPFGLDELLFDSLYDVFEGSALQVTNGLESSGLVLSAPLGEVARVYKRSTVVTEWGACITYAPPGSTPAYAAPSLSPLDQADDMLFRTKEEPLNEIPSLDYGYAQQISTFSSLLDVELSSAGGDRMSNGHAELCNEDEDEELEDEDDPQEKIVIRPEPLTQQFASPQDVEAGLQLIELCREGNLNAVTHRVRAGAPAGFITKSGWTPVAAAACSGFNDVLLYLLDIGADDTVAILLAAGYNPEAADTTGNRCLHLACSGGHRDVVEQLLAQSAAVEPCNKYGNRPLDLATEPACRSLLARFQSQTVCEWCKEAFSRLRRPSLCQHCHNVFCDTKPCSSTSTPTQPQSVIDVNGSFEPDATSTMLAQARSMRCCQECATEMGKAEQDLRNVLDSKLELIRRTLAVLDPSIGSRPTTSMSVLNEDVDGAGDVEGDQNSDRREASTPNDGFEEAAQLKAADNELLRVSRQTYRQLVAHVALQEEVKALLAERPIGIRSLLEPLKRALQHATREQVHAVMLSVALQIIQSAEAECTLFGCHALCEKIERGSRRYSKSIARLEASLAEAQRRGVSDKLLTAAGALRDRLNAEVRLEACLLPFKTRQSLLMELCQLNQLLVAEDMSSMMVLHSTRCCKLWNTAHNSSLAPWIMALQWKECLLRCWKKPQTC
ncbi:Leucine-rich repeat domain, L domain-like [Phytophthora cactorum]|nr:Leucine-rich repeat domain, L domain-like [Phytophthora cactorum]